MIDLLIMIMIITCMILLYNAGKSLYIKLFRKKYIKKDIWDGSDIHPGYDMLSKYDREIQKRNKFKMNR